MGVEAAESGNNNITEEVTNENEETERTAQEQMMKKWLEITFLRTKCFGM